MKKIVSFRTAATIVVSLNVAVIVFHLLVLSGIIPFHVVWGGRLESREEMLVFETVSILINAFLIFIVLAKARLVRENRRHMVVNVVLRVYVVIFLLNTVGNLVAETTVETLIATPLTMLLALLCYRLAVEKARA